MRIKEMKVGQRFSLSLEYGTYLYVYISNLTISGEKINVLREEYCNDPNLGRYCRPTCDYLEDDMEISEKDLL